MDCTPQYFSQIDSSTVRPLVKQNYKYVFNEITLVLQAQYTNHVQNVRGNGQFNRTQTFFSLRFFKRL